MHIVVIIVICMVSIWLFGYFVCNVVHDIRDINKISICDFLNKMYIICDVNGLSFRINKMSEIKNLLIFAIEISKKSILFIIS